MMQYHFKLFIKFSIIYKKWIKQEVSLKGVEMIKFSTCYIYVCIEIKEIKLRKQKKKMSEKRQPFIFYWITFRNRKKREK